MTPRQVRLVQHSFVQILSDWPAFIALFYDRVFALAPDVRAMFTGDMARQGAKLFAALELIVGTLDRLDPLLPAIDELAIRHRDYGVVERHYYVVGDALIWTLGRVGGDGWTDAHRQAWLQAWGVLSSRMIAATRASSGCLAGSETPPTDDAEGEHDGIPDRVE